MIDRNHPAVNEAARVMYQKQNEIDGLNPRWEGEDPATRGNWCDDALDALTAALPHLTADDLRNTPAGKQLMAEAWRKFQDHYATEWETSYHEGRFPSPEPSPAVVSRESVAAFMMRHWAKNLRSGSNPYKETPNE